MSNVDVASSYLDALVGRDASAVRLTPGVRRINNGRVSVSGMNELRESIRHEPRLTMGSERRWVVGDGEVAVFYELSAHIGDGAPVAACIGERFVFSGDAISEIEAVHTTVPTDSPGWAGGVARAEPEAGVEAAVRSYLGALVSHEAAAVMLTPAVRRVENGRITAEGEIGLRTSLESEIMESVQAISDEHWMVAGDSAVVFYSLRAATPGGDMTVRIAERFRCERGALTEIEAVFAPSE